MNEHAGHNLLAFISYQIKIELNNSYTLLNCKSFIQPFQDRINTTFSLTFLACEFDFTKIDCNISIFSIALLCLFDNGIIINKCGTY